MIFQFLILGTYSGILCEGITDYTRWNEGCFKCWWKKSCTSYILSISVTHVLALVTSVLALASMMLQCIFSIHGVIIPWNVFLSSGKCIGDSGRTYGRWSECMFLNTRNAFGDVEAYPGLKTEPQRRMHFFRFTNRFLQLTSASEQLLERLVELLLLKQFSAAGVFSAPSSMGAWGLCTGGGYLVLKISVWPHARAGGERSGLRQFLKQR